MQAVWVILEGAESRLARSKAEIREVLADPRRGSAHLILERTAAHEYDGLLLLAPREVRHYFVGPDPYYRRHWFGYFEYNDDTGMWEVQ